MTDDRGPPDLIARTTEFALGVIRFYGDLPRTTVAQVLGKQLLRSGTSVGSQYREAQRAKSIADFISKTQGSLQELDETAYWLELIEASAVIRNNTLKALRSETEQLICIFVTLILSAKQTKAGA
jgi:four helix bundle protein